MTTKGRLTTFIARTALLSCLIFSLEFQSYSRSATTKQQSLDEWRNLTAPAAQLPRVFVKGDRVRFYFVTEDGIEAFKAHWNRARAPTGRYKVHSALLSWDQRLSHIPEGERGWREAAVIAGEEWRQLASDLTTALTPKTPGHGAFYQAFLSDRLLYRDVDGVPKSEPATGQPSNIVIDHRFTIDETLELIARTIESRLATDHPGRTLFVLLAPDAKRFTQPLLLDVGQRRCILIAPAALYDTT